MELKKFSLILSYFLQNTIFTFSSPFFPVLAHEKGFTLWLIGIILASFALVSAIGSTIIGDKLESIGRRCAYTLSGILTGLGVLSWAILPYLDGYIFLIASFVGRMLQGLGTTFTLVAGFSIAASEYPDDVANVLS